MSKNLDEINKPKWSKNILKDWRLDRLKWCLSSVESGNRERGGGNLEGGVFSIGGEHISWSGELLLDNPKFISEDFYTQLKNGKIQPRDILLVKDGATIGKCAFIEEMPFKKCAVNEHVFILRGNDFFHNKFIYYFILSRYGQAQIYMEIRGAAQGGLISSFVSEFLLPYPKFSEQEAIVNFLDRKTAQIDSLISKKQRMIELLQEYRTALINQAVTKGLDPNVPMKESGYEWLGEIPEHWELIKLKFVSNVNFSNVDKHTYEEEIPIKLCNYVDVYNNDFIYPNMDFMNATATEKEISKFRLFKDDVIITKDSETWDDIAVPAYVTEDMEDVVCGYHLAQIKPLSINGYFLFWVLNSQSINDQYKVEAHGITRYGLGKDAIENSFIPIPPSEEQQRISSYLNNITRNCNEITKKTNKEIQLLNEYRTIIISDAVTGKIDVRYWKGEEDGIQEGHS